MKLRSRLMVIKDKLKELTNRDYIIPTSSGTAAIIISLLNSGIPKEAEVILPSICCPAVLAAVTLAGFTPIIADVNKEDFCMGKKEILEVFSNKTKAIIAVHSYGRYCKIDEIQEFAQTNNIFLIEDACLDIGGYFNDKPLGSFGDVSIFSFGKDKIIDIGGGGSILTDNNILFEKSKDFLNNNIFFSYAENLIKEKKFENKFASLRKNIIQRNINASIYDRLLDPEKFIKLQYKKDVVYWRYIALYKGNRKKLIEKAKKAGLIITTHYKALHQLRTGKILINAENISNQVINLFVNPESIDEKSIYKYIDFINNC